MDGVEILRQVPNAHKLPICIVTSSDVERELFRKEFGIADSNYLLKPVTHRGLLESSYLQGHLMRG
jgi:hypothetical protein